jgi:hypothetical protein
MLVSNADDVKKAMDAVYIGHARDQYRVSCYTAFCINCAEDPSLTNFRLATAFSFGINDNDKTPETIARLKRWSATG